MMFRHVLPYLFYKEKVIDFVDEFKRNNSRIHGGGRIARYLENSTYEEWLKYIERQKTLPVDETHVPEETCFLVDDSDDIIGIINIRLCLNDMLRDLGGHIGFSIRPSERGKGYNKINLYLGLKRLSEVGEKEALLDCEIGNKASSRTMMALGGRLVNTKNTEEFGVVEDYVIDIADSLKRFGSLYEQYIIDYKNEKK